MPEETPSSPPAQAPYPDPGAAAVAAQTPKPTTSKPMELAPEGMDCPHCGQRMRVFAKYPRSVEYCCPGLKEESPVLADKYAEWRDLLLKSRVSQTYLP